MPFRKRQLLRVSRHHYHIPIIRQGGGLERFSMKADRHVLLANHHQRRGYFWSDRGSGSSFPCLTITQQGNMFIAWLTAETKHTPLLYAATGWQLSTIAKITSNFSKSHVPFHVIDHAIQYCKKIQAEFINHFHHFPSLPSICLLDLRAHCACNLFSRRAPSKVARDNLLLANTLNTHHQLVGRLLLSKPPQHLSCRPECTNRVSDSLASDVERRSVDRLKHARMLPRWVEVRTTITKH